MCELLQWMKPKEGGKRSDRQVEGIIAHYNKVGIGQQMLISLMPSKDTFFPQPIQECR